MLTLHGKTIVGSVAIGPVHFFRTPERTIDESVHTDTEAQIRRFEEAVEKVAARQNELYEKTLEEAGEDDAAIFQVHAMSSSGSATNSTTGTSRLCFLPMTSPLRRPSSSTSRNCSASSRPAEARRATPPFSPGA